MQNESTDLNSLWRNIMQHRRWFQSFVVLAWGLLAGVGLAAETGWKAGIARANITPEQYMPMAGYAGRGQTHAEGKLTDLWAKVLILEDAQGHQAAWITLDAIGIDRPLSLAIREQIEKEQEWERSQIALCTSHTHTGPVVARNLQPMHYLVFDEENRKLVDDYAAFLQEQIVTAVREAVADLKPATLAWGSGEATFAVNRRNNPADQVPALREAGELKGPSDHDVPVLAVTRGETLAAVVFGYACHSTTLSSLEWSGDYAGFTQIALEEKYPGAQAMFWAGCGADQNPLPRRTVELCRDYGNQLAVAVSDVLEGTLRPISPRLKTAYREIDLPLGPLPDRKQLVEDTKSNNQFIAARARMLLEQVDAGTSLSPTYPYPIGVWQLGDEVTFVIQGGEVVVDYAIRLKGELGNEEWDRTNVWCAGYSNDVMAYIPSRRVLLEGGYEGASSMVYYGLPTVWAPEVEEMIAETVHELARDPR
jgi:neutral ceramidase